jgi:hypothetical protein
VVAFACSQLCRQSSHDITHIRPQDAFRPLDGCIGHAMEIVRPERGGRVYRRRRCGSIRQVIMPPPAWSGRSFRTVTKRRLRSRPIQWRGEPRRDGSGGALKVRAALAAVTAIGPSPNWPASSAAPKQITQILPGSGAGSKSGRLHQSTAIW